MDSNQMSLDQVNWVTKERPEEPLPQQFHFPSYLTA